MQHCKFCGWELPIQAYFCTNCGHVVGDSMQAGAYPSQQDLRTPNTPPAFSRPSNISGEASHEDRDAPTLRNWPGWEMAQNPPPYPGRQADDQRSALPDMLAPGMLLGQGQVPPAGQVPVVPGTPQVGGVPFVQGAPSMPGNPPPSWQGLVHEAAPSMPPRAASWEQQVPHHLHHTASVHARRFHVPRPHLHGSAAGTTKVAVGTVTKWVIVALTAIVVAATAGTVFVLANSPGLSFLNGSSSVAFGDTLHVHGKGFLPGGSVTLTLDNGAQVSPVAQGASPNSAGSSLMLLTGQLQQQADVSVSVTGDFDAAIVVLPSWSSGKHTIHATESLGSRSADLQFTIRSTPARLVVSPSSLNFPQLQVGSKAVQSIEVGNSGQANLNWTAVTDGSKWLKLQEVAGSIEPSRSDQFIDVIADASQLQAGTYHATISIHSNGGDAQVPVNLNVVNSVKKQPQLTVTPQGLDFGQLSINQQMTRAISVGNLGQLPLNWQASAGGTPWLTLNKSSGTVQPGALPQTIQLTVNTAGLAPGNYSATINITSNGGIAQVSITLAVIGTTPTPSPSPSPTPTPSLSPSPSPSPPPPPLWSVSPTALNGSSCGITSPCTVTLTEDPSSTGNISWSASSDVTATFNPSSGTLNPGGQAQVSISGMACKNGTFTFTASGAAQPQSLTVSWTCTPPPPPPSWSVNPTSLDGSSCGVTNACTVTLMEDASSTGNISWSASSDVGATFNPSSGTLNPGGQAQVSISNVACQNTGTFTFKASGAAQPQSLTVSWTCTPPPPPPSWSVSPTSLDGSSCGVTNACTVTLTEASSSTGNVSWSASSDVGASFSPSSGTLSPGQQTPVSISGMACKNGTFTFTASGAAQPQSLTVSWTCTPPPPPPSWSVSPTSLDGSSCGVTNACTVTLTEASSSTGNISWSADSDVGATFNPFSGTLSPSQNQVQVSISNIACKNGTFTFTASGAAQPQSLTVSWTCTPPTITVTPGGNCPSDGKGNDVCTDTLQESGGPGTVNWTATAESDLPGTNLPQSGSLPTGQSVQVMVVIPISDCPAGGGVAGHFDYTWPTGSYRVTFSCNPPSIGSPQKVLSSSFVPPFAALASVAGFAVIGRRTRGRKCDGTL